MENLHVRTEIMEDTYLCDNLIGRSPGQLFWQVWRENILHTIRRWKTHRFGRYAIHCCCNTLLHVQRTAIDRTQWSCKCKIHGTAQQKSHSMFYYPYHTCSAKQFTVISTLSSNHCSDEQVYLFVTGRHLRSRLLLTYPGQISFTGAAATCNLIKTVLV